LFKIIYSLKAIKELEKYDKCVAQKIIKKIKKLQENPFHFLEKLVSVNLWKLRVGDCRVIILLKRSKKEIQIVDIGHRKKIYKNL